MMHTLGLVEVDDCDVCSRQGTNLAVLANTYHSTTGGDPDANARRFAACWNALSGISTEAIESGAVAELIEAARTIYVNQNCSDGNAPGHGHRQAGIWDDEIGNKSAGNIGACEWCAEWSRFRNALAKFAPANMGDAS